MPLTSGYTDPSPYKERYVPLIGVDDTVTPPIPMMGMLGWAGGAAWEKITSDGSGNLSFTLDSPNSVISGQTTVTTAGVRVVLGAGAVLGVTIKAKSTNTGFIYVGDVAVTNANGYILQAGESISLDIDSLADIYLDSSVNLEGVSYLAVAA